MKPLTILILAFVFAAPTFLFAKDIPDEIVYRRLDRQAVLLSIDIDELLSGDAPNTELWKTIKKDTKERSKKLYEAYHGTLPRNPQSHVYAPAEIEFQQTRISILKSLLEALIISDPSNREKILKKAFSEQDAAYNSGQSLRD